MSEDFTVPELQIGTYEHYKGKQYEVIGVALHTETLEPMVVYRPLYQTDVPLWIRPFAMFVSTVEIDGAQVPRFRRIDT